MVRYHVSVHSYSPYLATYEADLALFVKKTTREVHGSPRVTLRFPFPRVERG